MAHDVFISYSSSNKPVADAICAGLEAEKLRCWIAPRDVLPGQNYGESIVHAIAGCKVMVLVFSGATNVSQAVIREAERAMHNSKPIIPFRIEDTPMSPGLEFFLASCHWLDAIQPPMDAHIAHLARSVKGLIGEVEYIPEKTPSPPPRAKPNRTPAVIAGAVVLAAAGGFFAWKSSQHSAPSNPTNTPAAASPGITLTASLAGAGNGAIASHFSSGNSPRYQASESDGVLTIDPASAPAPGKLTVVSPSSDENWLTIPTVELDLKLLNSGTTTAFFQRAVLEVSSSQPENKPVWLADGTRLPGIFAVHPLGGDESAPSISLGIAGPEDSIDRSKLPAPATAKKGKNGSFEFPLPRALRPGIEETLFGRVNDLTFEIPLAATPPSKPAAAPKDPEPLYIVQLHESGENYTVTCDLSQYIQAGEGDRFFLRIGSPVIARHRFSVKLEYDDGSGAVKFLKGPTVDATLYPSR
ncbi:MAG: toll/interleukin-1 receptor domain-containing protein [Luteolibacter sp.]